MASRKKYYTRRKFIKIAGTVAGASAISAALAACSDSATPTSVANTQVSLDSTTPGGPTATPVAIPTTLAVVRSAPTNYLLFAPAIMRPGSRERVSVTLLAQSSLVSDNVQVQLTRAGTVEAQATGQINGRGELTLLLPDNLAEGAYNLEFKSGSFLEQATVTVETTTLLFIETDKPIYKPGQTVQARLLTLDTDLKPRPNQKVTVEITEAKGSKIFKQTVQTDEYGLGRFELPLSSEPNLGAWKITATLDKRKTTLDFTVEKYVLPKYKIEIQPESTSVIAGNRVKGKVKAEYNFGKPVQGELELRLYQLQGGNKWSMVSTLTKEINGELEYDLPTVQGGYYQQYDQYGQPTFNNTPTLRLEATVREKNTGYEESTKLPLIALNTAAALKLVPEGVAFKPGLPFSFLVATQDPANKPVEAKVTLTINYTLADYKTKQETRRTDLKEGPVALEITPPADAMSLTIYANAELTAKNQTNAYRYQPTMSLYQTAAYSPSKNYLGLRQVNRGPFKADDTLQFKVNSTLPVSNGVFWEALAGDGSTIQSGYTTTNEISFKAAAALAPTARLLAYQVLSDGEIVADYLPFSLEGKFPHKVQATFDKSQTEPGQEVNLKIQTEGQAKVGLALIDRAVYVLGENRLNLSQILGEIEKLQKKPTLETNASRQNYGELKTYGSKELIAATGLLTLSNCKLPVGQKISYPVPAPGVADAVGVGAAGAPARAAATTAAATIAATASAGEAGGGLAQVERVRQFFPETWLWDNQLTDANGLFAKKLTTPDSITTWTLNAVALSPKAGLGMTQTELQVIQPFFVQVDTVYSAIRGEEFPVNVALYNYTKQAEKFFVELDKSSWFDGLSDFQQSVIVQPNDVGSVSFKIRAKELGSRPLKITARSTNRADALIKELLIEPEGLAREIVDNVVLTPDKPVELDLTIPASYVDGSARAYIALTGNFMTQSIEGLENLLKMPYGCGEQNMILCAPNVYISSYLKASGQSKPELQSKITTLLLTGYQRELTYQRTDGSFSAFGNNDRIGSLWLTAFVLKTFSQARDLIYIDEALLQKAANWIAQQQRRDGSFEPVGFVHHQDLMGGLNGNIALTAYVAAALLEFGEKSASAKALSFLESKLDGLSDPYGLAQTAYTLKLGQSSKAGDTLKKLLDLGKAGEEGLYWQSLGNATSEQPGAANAVRVSQPANKSANIETTGYGLLALSSGGDKINGANVARWLVSQRNAYGGWSSTQDTVVGLAALAGFIASNKSDIDGTIAMQGSNWQKEARITSATVDVLQQFDAPLSKVKVEFKGKGQAVLQAVRRYNVPKATAPSTAFKLDVQYGASELAINKPLEVNAIVQYTPPTQTPAGMVVLEVALPTGFVADSNALEQLRKQPKVKRIDQSGRRLQIYIDDMQPGDILIYKLQANAMYPVKAQAVASQVYAYYRTEWQAESLGGAITVR